MPANRNLTIINLMEAEVAAQLLEINKQFYQTFAISFSETRRRLQPGVLRLLDRIPSDDRILDLGCGNGTLALTLCRRSHRGPYLGLDFSREMLAEAHETIRGLQTGHSASRGEPGDHESLSRHPEMPDSEGSFRFLQADLAAPDWSKVLDAGSFDICLALAVLHHLPGSYLRHRILDQVRLLLAPTGRLMLSNWQFLNSPRLRERIQPWERAALKDEQVDAEDYLLDWRRGGSGLRYAHHFSSDELETLAGETGFQVQESFYSDGEGGRLGLYQIWTLA
jgi:tRNA (uracil-5-)-methyltransferase TRM9